MNINNKSFIFVIVILLICIFYNGLNNQNIITGNYVRSLNLIRNGDFSKNYVYWIVEGRGYEKIEDGIYVSFNPDAEYGSFLKYEMMLNVNSGEKYEFGADFKKLKRSGKATLQYETYDYNGNPFCPEIYFFSDNYTTRCYEIATNRIWNNGKLLIISDDWREHVGSLIIPQGVHKLKLKIRTNYYRNSGIAIDNIKLIQIIKEDTKKGVLLETSKISETPSEPKPPKPPKEPKPPKDK